MNRLYLSLEDGTVFEGWCESDALETAGLLSFYTGITGYQEVISNPANLGKIILFTYPLIGNYGVNDDDSESSSPKVAGILAKEISSLHSNFRATASLSDYLCGSSVCIGSGFDTRAVLLHIREHGEMNAALAPHPIEPDQMAQMFTHYAPNKYIPENISIACGQAYPKLKATVADFGASKSFFKYLSDKGIDACGSDEKARALIVSDAPHFVVEDPLAIEHVRAAAKGRPIIGFGHGAYIAAKAIGCDVSRMKFGEHGCNIPVRSHSGGRNEITTQSHNYQIAPAPGLDVLFSNLHDNSIEGFAIPSGHVAGVNFLPKTEWLDILLAAAGVE